MDRMRAVVQRQWGGAEMLRIEDVARPEPQPTEVLVRVEAAGVNPVDYYTREGLAYNATLSLPFVNGWDVAGTVVEVGYGVTRFEVGDRVFGMPWFPRQAGCYAEYVTVPSRQLATIPRQLSFSAAAALPLAGLTAWQILVDIAGLRAGQRVLVSGASGGVGHLAVQVAKAFDAYVIGTASPEKHQAVLDLGCDEVFDYRRPDLAEQVRDIDVAIQMFGGTSTLGVLECMRPGGILINGQGAWTEGMADKGKRLRVRTSDFLVEPDGCGLDALSELVVGGKLSVDVVDELPLEQAAKAHEVVAGRHTVGKIVLTP